MGSVVNQLTTFLKIRCFIVKDIKPLVEEKDYDFVDQEN
jgi:hypothetical protein